MKTGGKQYEIEYKEQFIKDVQAHKKSGNKSLLIKINNLIDELREHPTTGTGSPWPLKNSILNSGTYWLTVGFPHRTIYSSYTG
jgi:toxin YoeB